MQMYRSSKSTINIKGRAFTGQGAGYETQVKLGVLGGSLVAGLLGVALLLGDRRQRRR